MELHIPGHAEANMGRAVFSASFFLYLLMNSLQLSRRLKSRVNVVSNTKWAPKERKGFTIIVCKPMGDITVTLYKQREGKIVLNTIKLQPLK